MSQHIAKSIYIKFETYECGSSQATLAFRDKARPGLRTQYAPTQRAICWCASTIHASCESQITYNLFWYLPCQKRHTHIDEKRTCCVKLGWNVIRIPNILYLISCNVEPVDSTPVGDRSARTRFPTKTCIVGPSPLTREFPRLRILPPGKNEEFGS